MEMILKVHSALGKILEQPVSKITFEAIDGFFTLLPRHVDFVSALKTGILTFVSGEKTFYLACHEGVLLKKGKIVSISTKLGIVGDDIQALSQKIAQDFKEMDEARKETNKAMAKLEISLTKGIMAAKKGEDLSAHL